MKSASLLVLVVLTIQLMSSIGQSAPSFFQSNDQSLKACLADCQSLIPDHPIHVVRQCVYECQKKHQLQHPLSIQHCETYEPGCDQMDGGEGETVEEEDDMSGSEGEGTPDGEEGEFP